MKNLKIYLYWSIFSLLFVFFLFILIKEEWVFPTFLRGLFELITIPILLSIFVVFGLMIYQVIKHKQLNNVLVLAILGVNAISIVLILLNWN
jgi:hypothetical protein